MLAEQFPVAPPVQSAPLVAVLDPVPAPDPDGIGAAALPSRWVVHPVPRHCPVTWTVPASAT
jgi:hypothetical protein